MAVWISPTDNPTQGFAARNPPLVTKISMELLQEWKDLPTQSLSTTFRRDAEKRIVAKGFSPDVARIAASPLGKG
jgi:hypothetical protein